jgi:N-acetylmuramate 1-kinase
MVRANLPEKMPASLERRIQSAGEFEALAAELSLFASPGMAVLLRGELGAGKSTFARAFIGALMRETGGIDVPSPTFTLLQTYNETRIPVAHADFFRTNSPAETEELGLDELLGDHVLLVEWPERMAAMPWENVLNVEISGRGSGRLVRLRGEGQWAQALNRNRAINVFLAGTAWKNAKREFLEGDASFRRYEVLKTASASAILMDMPARPDGPPVKDGKPYSAVAHLAEDIRAVIAINGKLCELGYSAPVTYAYDIAAGFAVIEDLGRHEYSRRPRHA